MTLPDVLAGKLWHTTSEARHVGICQAGAILPEPPVHDTDRWGTAHGPEFYPYVRHLGGVSLFDFRAFEEDSYRLRFPLSNWEEFVPCRPSWGAAIWIEVDRTLLGASLVSGADLLAQWKAEGAYRHRLMPLIEAAHLGPLPVTAFRHVLHYGNGRWSPYATA